MSAGEGIAWMSRSVSFADVAGEAAREAARRAGVLDGDLELVRVGERAVLRLDGGRVIARAARGLDRFDAVRLEVEVARWLTSEGMPVTVPYRRPFRWRPPGQCGTPPSRRT